MEIPVYQIHKVMKVYTKQLSQSKLYAKQTVAGKKSSVDKINISAEGKRKAIVDKIAADVVERIRSFGPKDEFDRKIVDTLEKEVGGSVHFTKNKKASFVFNIIDEKNNKTKNTLSVDNSDYLLQRLEQLTKEAVDRNMEL